MKIVQTIWFLRKCIELNDEIWLGKIYSGLIIIKFIIRSRGLFVRQIEESYRGQSTNEKYHIEPSMIEREL